MQVPGSIFAVRPSCKPSKAFSTPDQTSLQHCASHLPGSSKSCTVSTSNRHSCIIFIGVQLASPSCGTQGLRTS